jgi:predicted PurR-regulated permease PerM
VAVFSITFISFFFIKDDGLFTQIVCSLVPDKHEKTTEKAIDDIEHLLSRYFIGVTVEIMGVALLNFLGLWLIARIGINAAVCIAMITGILNVIPYIGPLMGCVLGTSLALIIKFSSAVPIGLDMGFWGFAAVVLGLLCFTQIIDNVLYQPLIYSTSIKSKPLEIFLVLLIVGYIGGPFAMIVAIPTYTVFRVIAFRFFRHVKAIRRLIPSEKLISENE